ncbi:hypothetical protein PMI09_04418 [Rhizobium sp. CF122]|uniref:hypothetical protein n=1 Tax=Rhizobium sp. CF122 TaxID=1144312 RepID=UPI000271A983|nr:hypothetical protein [Rhizobium sp. CF122]EJL51628.1 hypothetical protein PMI09_04418 [Rhizobium sp. CF122]
MLAALQTPIARFIEEHANRSCYSYEEIALLCGFKTSDMIYCFMRGDRKVPLDKVAPLAEALGCDSAQLFVLALKSWFSDELFNQLEECFGAMHGDKAERGWILALREVFGGEVPEITVKMRRRLQILVGKAA